MGNILRRISQYFTGKESLSQNPDHQARAQAESYKIPVRPGDINDVDLFLALQAARDADAQRHLSSSGTDLYCLPLGRNPGSGSYMGPNRAPVDPQPEIFVDGRDFEITDMYAADLYTITDADFTVNNDSGNSGVDDDGGAGGD